MSNDNWLRPQLLLALKLDRVATFGSSINRRMDNRLARDPVSSVRAEDRYLCLAGRSHRQNHPRRSSAATLRIAGPIFEGDDVMGQGGADLNSALRPSEPFAVPWAPSRSKADWHIRQSIWARRCRPDRPSQHRSASSHGGLHGDGSTNRSPVFLLPEPFRRRADVRCDKRLDWPSGQC